MQKFVLYTKTQADKVNDRKLGQEDADKIIRYESVLINAKQFLSIIKQTSFKLF